MLRVLYHHCRDRETVRDWMVQNQISALLEPRFPLPAGPGLVPTDSIKEIFRTDREGDAWERFQVRYPTAEGILRLSRVGLNRARDEAAVVRAFSCGWLCGGGSLKVYERKGETWVYRTGTGLWVN